MAFTLRNMLVLFIVALVHYAPMSGASASKVDVGSLIKMMHHRKVIEQGSVLLYCERQRILHEGVKRVCKRISERRGTPKVGFCHTTSFRNPIFGNVVAVHEICRVEPGALDQCRPHKRIRSLLLCPTFFLPVPPTPSPPPPPPPLAPQLPPAPAPAPIDFTPAPAPIDFTAAPAPAPGPVDSSPASAPTPTDFAPAPANSPSAPEPSPADLVPAPANFPSAPEPSPADLVPAHAGPSPADLVPAPAGSAPAPADIIQHHSLQIQHKNQCN